MKTNFAVLGTFVLVGVILLTTVLFVIGNRDQAFSKHENLYIEMATVTGIAPGSKVRVGGLDAGEVKMIELPSRPSAKFRVKLEVERKLHSLIRNDSLVTVESDGLVGDKFLMIHAGTDVSPEAESGSTLPSKEPVELSAIIEKVSGTVDQVNATIGDVRGRLDGTLDVVTKTVTNTNGLVTDVRSGQGTVGTLLSDQQTADQVRRAVSNVQQASVNLNRASAQAQQLMSDVESRNLPAKLDDTVVNARDASQQISQVSHKVNATISDALAPDESGLSAAQNLRDTFRTSTARPETSQTIRKHSNMSFSSGASSRNGAFTPWTICPRRSTAPTHSFRTRAITASGSAAPMPSLAMPMDLRLCRYQARRRSLRPLAVSRIRSKASPSLSRAIRMTPTLADKLRFPVSAHYWSINISYNIFTYIRRTLASSL